MNRDRQSADSAEEDSPELREALQHTVRGGSVGLVGLGFSKGAAFALHILLTRFLGATSYGLFALGRAIMSIASSIGALGSGTGVVRFVSKHVALDDSENADEYFRSALFVAVFGSLLVATGLFLLSPLIADVADKPDLETPVRYFSLALPAYTLFAVTTSLFQAKKNISAQQGLKGVVVPSLRIIIVGAALVLGWGLSGAVLGFAASGFIGLGIALWLVKKEWPSLLRWNRISWPHGRKVLRYSVPVLLSGLTSVLALRIDRVLLGYMKPASEVGLYNVAALIGFNARIVNRAAMGIAKPVISEVFEGQGDDLLAQVYRATARWTTFISFLFILPMVLYGDVLLSLFGSEYERGMVVLIVFLAYSQLAPVNGPTGVTLKMTGKQDLELTNGIAVVLGVIGFDLILIPPFGAYGAAVGTLLASMTVELIRVGELYYHHRFHPYNFAHGGLVASIAVVGTTAYWFGIGQGVLVKAIVFVVALSAVMAISRALATPEDEYIFGLVIEQISSFAKHKL